MIESDSSRPQGPVMIATWPFGKLAVDAAAESLAAGGSGLDGIETGIRLIESLGHTSGPLRLRREAAGCMQSYVQEQSHADGSTNAHTRA